MRTEKYQAMYLFDNLFNITVHYWITLRIARLT